MPALVELARKIVKHRVAIDHALDSGLSNALFGFHGPEPLIALALLALGSQPHALPGRT